MNRVGKDELSTADLGTTLLAVTEKAKIGLVIGVLGEERVGPIFLSEAAVELFGHPRAELMRGNLLDFVAPEERDRVHDLIDRIIAGEAAGPSFESIVVHADGRRVPVDVTFVQVVHRGHVLTVNFLVDVSERKELEAKLARTDRLAAIGTLAAGVAHEINNPLTAMTLEIASLQKLLLESPLDEALRRDALARLDDVATGTNRVASIVRDLRTLSHNDADAPMAIDVWSIVASAKRLAAHALDGRARVVVTETPLPLVLARSLRLEQVFVNLFVNAAQAFDEASDHNVIRVSGTVDANGNVVVEVNDNGPGIPPEMQRRVFDPFFTTKPSGVGTGLGLALSQATLTSLGGELSLASTPGQGATFRVVLRPAPVLASAAHAPRTERRARVLVIDDEPSIRRSLGALLSPDYEVELIANGEQALRRIIEGDPFDAILCDVTLGALSGVDVYERIASERAGHERRLVFMTGGALRPEVDDFLARLPNPRLAKPFELADLERALQTVLGH